MVTMLLLFLRIVRIGANFSQSLDALPSPFAQVRAPAGQNLIKFEERCADASRLQPRVARPGSSAFAQLRRDKPTRLKRATADHFSPTFGRRGDLPRGRLITNHPGIRDSASVAE